jgi:hypothetical protein
MLLSGSLTDFIPGENVEHASGARIQWFAVDTWRLDYFECTSVQKPTAKSEEAATTTDNGGPENEFMLSLRLNGIQKDSPPQDFPQYRMRFNVQHSTTTILRRIACIRMGLRT